MIRRIVTASLLGALLLGATPPQPGLSPAQNAALRAYISALGKGRYDAAFTLLSRGEQRYFGDAANFGSVFAADRLRVGKFKVLRTERARGVTVAFVSEDVAFFDHAHQAAGTATARVAYGLLDEGGAVKIKDPYHPWRVLVPNADAQVDKLRAIVRKVSFFTGRVEFMITFQNLGDGTVTLLPYGRSLLKDDAGNAYRLVVVKLSALTDKRLFEGLLLPSSGQYTGTLNFFTPDRFTPKRLDLTLGKMLRDGADQPFEVPLPGIETAK